MELIAVFPDPPPPDLARTLDLGRLPLEGRVVGRRGGAPRAGRRLGRRGRRRATPTPRARGRCAGRCASATPRSRRCCVLVSGAQLADLELRNELFDDFCLTPFHPIEVEARLQHLLWRGGDGVRPDMVEYSGLALNLETYQASIAGRPLDLTYMEYELLKFLAQNPGKVFTREMLLSAGVGLRVLRRRPHGRRPHPPPARQARRGARQPDPDRALGRLPLRPEPLGRR